MANIKYRISLEGGEQVAQELLTVEEAVKRLQDAAKSSTGADTFASTTAAISKLGSTTQEALGAAAAAAQKFGASANELARVEGIINALDKRARQGGFSFQTLAENYDKARASAGDAVPAQEKLAESTAKVAFGAAQARTALRVLGAEVRTVGAALATAGVPIGGLASSLASLGVAATGAGPVLGTIAVAVSAASVGAIAAVAVFAKFAEGAKETVDALNKLSQKGDSSFEFISSMQQAFRRGGVALNEFAKNFENLQDKLAQARPTALTNMAESAEKAARATLSVSEASVNLAEAQAKAAAGSEGLNKAEQEYFAELRRGNAVTNARLQLEAAQREERIADANNLETLAGKYEKLSKGVEQTFNPLTTFESKAKALWDMLAKGGKVLGPLDLELEKTGTLSEKNNKALLKLADVFKNIRSEAERMQLGKAMGFSPEFIQQLSLGSEALRRIQNEVKGLGLGLTKFDQENVQKFKASQATLGAVFEALRDKMGALAAPAFTSFFEGLTERLKELSPEFQKLAEAFGQIDFTSLGQAVGDLILKFSRLGVAIAQAFEAASHGDFSGLTDLITNLTATIVQAMASMGKAAGEAFLNALKEALTPEGGFNLQSIFDAILKDLAKFGESVLQNWEILKKKLSGGFISPAGAGEAGGGQLGGADFGPMIAAAEVAAVRIKQIFAEALSQSMTIDFSGIATAAQDVATELQLLFSTASEQITESFSSIDISSVLSAQIDALITKFGQLATAARAAAAAAAGAASGGGGEPVPERLARGGLFGGRGTGTSDSNLAWLSRGEHIMPARAVRQPGVLAFLEALRRSGGDLSRILDGMGRFALGGLVPMRAIPAFAAGGLNRGMSNVTIQFPGLPAISGLRASSDVVDQLHRAAALAQVRSGGRKPSRYS